MRGRLTSLPTRHCAGRSAHVGLLYILLYLCGLSGDSYSGKFVRRPNLKPFPLAAIFCDLGMESSIDFLRRKNPSIGKPRRCVVSATIKKLAVRLAANHKK